MKSILVGAGLVVLLIGTVVWEESRVTALKGELDEAREKLVKLEKAAAKREAVASRAAKPSSPAARDREQVVKRDRSGEEGGEKKRDGLGETFRKIFENPAGRAMINEENKTRAARLYGALVEEFNLTEEEEEYFIELLAPGVGEEDAVGMKLFGANSDEEREQILDDMEQSQEERRQSVKDFLNDEEDFAKYERYQDRKSEYEQLPSIQAVMKETGSPMTSEQESALVEAMYEARTETGLSERWEGRAGFEQFGEPGASKRFEDDWVRMQGTLDGKVGGVLDEGQREAFGEHQEQIKQFALMGIRMVEGMIENAR